MASNYCSFCDIVGSQQISNERKGFNYSTLEVKKKEGKTSTKGEKDELKVLYSYLQCFCVKNTYVSLNIQFLLWACDP
jgi:hypothetical protein